MNIRVEKKGIALKKIYIYIYIYTYMYVYNGINLEYRKLSLDVDRKRIIDIFM